MAYRAVTSAVSREDSVLGIKAEGGVIYCWFDQQERDRLKQLCQSAADLRHGFRLREVHRPRPMQPDNHILVASGLVSLLEEDGEGRLWHRRLAGKGERRDTTGGPWSPVREGTAAAAATEASPSPSRALAAPATIAYRILAIHPIMVGEVWPVTNGIYGVFLALMDSGVRPRGLMEEWAGAGGPQPERGGHEPSYLVWVSDERPCLSKYLRGRGTIHLELEIARYGGLKGRLGVCRSPVVWPLLL
jgi:hypothetical protein